MIPPEIDEPWTGTLLFPSPYNIGPYVFGLSPPLRDLCNQRYTFRPKTDSGNEKVPYLLTPLGPPHQKRVCLYKKFYSFIVLYIF